MTQLFSTETAGLELASPPQTVRLGNGDRFDLRISPVANRIGDNVLRMLAYNGSIPGPVLHVDQGTEIEIEVRNDGDTEATVHWHGLRLENRFDGVPHETQAPIPIGGTFRYKLQFPDAGFYWYHPHVREDFGLEMGLYGTIIVEPSDPAYWPAVDRHQGITLDDLLVEEGHIAPFSKDGPTFTAMGRYGNVMLTNGQTRFTGQAAVGEVVRLYLVNTANTRIFNVALPGARMKLVGGDSGRYERETFVEEVLLAPSERAVVDVLFDTPGEVRLEHRTPDHVYNLGSFWVAGTATGDAARTFDQLCTDPELTAARQALAGDMERAPDKVLAFSSSMPLLYGGPETAATSYACPMHPEVTSGEAGTCPKCGMRLVAVEAAKAPAATSYACPMHPDVTATEPGTCPKWGMKLLPSDAPPAAHHGEHGQHGQHGQGGQGAGDGLEWEDLMPEINRQTNPSNMIWKLIDRHTGDENGAIRWAFTVGDRVKIRLVNEMEGSDHPMHHPFHVHGAGRFLVLSRKACPRPIWCGRTPCSSRRGRRSTSCSTSPIRECGWPTATSPSTPERDDVQLRRLPHPVVTRPVILAVDDDPTALATIEAELSKRYGEDYDVLAHRSAEAGLGDLRRLRDDGRTVALLLAGLWMSSLTGIDLLALAGGLHPTAERGLLVDWVDNARSKRDLVEASALGQVDCTILKPVGVRDEQFHHVVTELLREWARAHDDGRPAVRVVGDQWSPRGHEVKDLLARYGISFRSYAPDSPEGRAVLEEAGADPADCPVLALDDGRVLVNPTNGQAADAFGANLDHVDGEFDVAVVGAGPAGLAAAVYAASEGCGRSSSNGRPSAARPGRRRASATTWGSLGA